MNQSAIVMRIMFLIFYNNFYVFYLIAKLAVTHMYTLMNYDVQTVSHIVNVQ